MESHFVISSTLVVAAALYELRMWAWRVAAAETR